MSAMRAMTFAAALALSCSGSVTNAPTRMAAARQVGSASQDATQSYVSGSSVLRGADPTGTFDSAPALNHWLAAGPGQVFLSCGTYRIKGAVTFSVVGTYLVASPCVTLKIDDSAGNIGNAFTWVEKRNGGIIGGPLISAYSTRSAGYAVHIQGGDPTNCLGPYPICAGQISIDVDMEKQYSGVLVDDDASTGNWGAAIGNAGRLAIWRDFNIAGDGVLINSPSGASHVIERVFIANQIGAANHAGIHLKGTGDVQIHGVSTWEVHNGLLIDNSAPFCLTACLISLSDNEFDVTPQGTTDDAIRIAPVSDGAAGVVINAMNNWIASGYNGIRAIGFTGRMTVVGGSCGYNIQYCAHGSSGTTASNIVIDPSVTITSNGIGTSLFD